MGVCKDCGVAKPWLYDVIAVFPFWPLWMYTQVPLFALVSLAALIVGEPPEPPPVHLVSSIVWLIIQGVYYYLIACIVGTLWQRFIGGQRNWLVNVLGLIVVSFLGLQLLGYFVALVIAPLGTTLGHHFAAVLFLAITNILITAGGIGLIVVLLRRRPKSRQPECHDSGRQHPPR